MATPYHKLNDLQLARIYLTKSTNALSAGHTFDLTFAQFKRVMKRKRCQLSGIPFKVYIAKDTTFTALTIDRIDNTKGYVQGNVLAVCAGINSMKAVWENPTSLITETTVRKVLTNLKRYK